MYQELSTKVDKVSYNIVVNMMMASFSTCNDKSAWDPKNTENYQNCTKQISASRRHIQENFKNVEFFSMNYHGTIHTEMEKILDLLAQGGHLKPLVSTDTQSRIPKAMVLLTQSLYFWWFFDLAKATPHEGPKRR